MPSSHLILCCPLLLLPSVPPSIRVFSNESTLCMRWPKYWSFSFSISPSNEQPGLISFRMDWLDLLAVKGITSPGWMHETVLRAGALGRPRGMGWGGRWEGWLGWGIHVNPWLIHVSVWQKPPKYCKVISLQLIKNKWKKKVFSNTTVQKHQFFGSQLSWLSNSHIHTWPLEKP